MKEARVPQLDLTPKLKRLLSPWNPLDYFRLLYWTFFFPQALRWYVDTFGNPGYRQTFENGALFEALRNDPVQWRLFIQGVIILSISLPGLTLGLLASGIPVSWAGMLIGVAFIVVAGLRGGIEHFVAFSVVGSIAGTVTGVLEGLVESAVKGIIEGGVLGAMQWLAAFVMSDGEAKVVAFLLTFWLVFFMAVLVAGAVTAILVGGINDDMAFGATGFAFVFLAVFRLPDYLFVALHHLMMRTMGRGVHQRPNASRVVFLPVPGLQKQMEKWLAVDWDTGLYNINQLLSYTMQFIPLVKAVNKNLSHTPENFLLSKVAVLADMSSKWHLNLIGALDLENWKFYSPLPKEPLLDTPAHAACAGFWYWQKQVPSKAVEAFEVIRDIRYGRELYGIARAITRGKQLETIREIADWAEDTDGLETLPSPVLRPGTLSLLRILYDTARDARVAINSQSPLNSITVISRANTTLLKLIDTGEQTCPQPEWTMLKEISQKWRDILTKAGGTMSEALLRQPVHNPYEGYSGRPVTGHTFVGRTGIMKQIGDRWAVEGLLPPLIIFGHRRMGKTSILRNLENSADSNVIFIYLDMQNSGLVEHTGELLLDFAETIHNEMSRTGMTSAPPPAKETYSDLGTGRRSFNVLMNNIDTFMTGQKRLFLAIDEFELLQIAIDKGLIDADILSYLRSLTQDYKWLGLIFAGLHTLEEMGRDYHSAFYGQAEYIRVGYLEYDDVIRLITKPHPGFVLEYSRELLEEIYHLTFGQPYLLQRLCWELITHWNNLFLKEGKNAPRTLTVSDLASVLTSDFYESAEYYFNGVWDNVTGAEQQLMHVLAQRQRAVNPWPRDQLPRAASMEPSAFEDVLKLLRRHDVVIEGEMPDGRKYVRFASELMRRWVADLEKKR
ncbi:MAG: AAA family ATPase [bacterium]|nr:AAA family ATPase [bacterium]